METFSLLLATTFDLIKTIRADEFFSQLTKFFYTYTKQFRKFKKKNILRTAD